MTAEVVRVSSGWLDLREPADAAARSTELVRELRFDGGSIHDLGCGSGAMGRWLAPLLRGPQRWVLHDRDADLLALAAAHPPGPAVEVETRLGDITQLTAESLTGSSLITASALLDLLTAAELAGVIDACAAAGCPVLFTLSVDGHVQLDPAAGLDTRLEAAFNAHQHRGGRLGPDAVAFAAEQFRRIGSEVILRPSPWSLGATHTELAVAWFDGWLGAACEQEAELVGAADLYRRRRLRESRTGDLAVTVGHVDLLVLP